MPSFGRSSTIRSNAASAASVSPVTAAIDPSSPMTSGWRRSIRWALSSAASAPSISRSSRHRNPRSSSDSSRSWRDMRPTVREPGPRFAAAARRRYRLAMRFVAILACAVALAGCPGKRHTIGIKVPTNGDPEARSRFLEAQAAFRRDGEGADEFAAIVEDYPDDPIAPYAQVYNGIALIGSRDFAAADKALVDIATAEGDELDKNLRLKARMYLGIAKNYEGQHAKALGFLQGAEPAAEDAKEQGEWLAAISVATAAGDAPLDSLPYFDRWYPLGTYQEKGFILARVGEVVAAAPADAARTAFDAIDKKGPGAAILGYRVAADREANGDIGGAKKARESVAGARKSIGLPLVATASSGASGGGGGGTPGLIGAILPQSGKQVLVGEYALQGLEMATVAAGGSNALTVDVRSAETPEDAGAAVDELVAAGAIALIGPIAGDPVDTAANRANALHVPLLSLSPSPERRVFGDYVFHVMHSA